MTHIQKAIFLVTTGSIALVGCGGSQSTLQPAGENAERIADLFWWMFAGGTLIWCAVIGAAVYFMRIRPGAHNETQARWLILGGGVIFPVIVLAILLLYGLFLLASLREPEDPTALTVSVTGEQWWWRVRYESAEGEAIELANEIRLPVGERVRFILDSPDVIHSFWIPSLAGKVDMIPGRTTTLSLRPTKPGVYRGACAEFCGTSHALMNFQVVVLEQAQYEQWLEHQAAPAQSPTTPIQKAGKEAFFANGCSACHTIRGTRAQGSIGPDLTHVGSRLGIGADVLPNTLDGFKHWISHTEEVKPDVKMPSFGMLENEDVEAMAAYLGGLK